jgi:hypothetical protein
MEKEELERLAHEYAVNVAKTINNGLESNIVKMNALSKLNAVAYDTYSRTYDSLVANLEESKYNENKK